MPSLPGNSDFNKSLETKPRRYKRVHTLGPSTKFNLSDDPRIYRSIGHRSIQQASFNKSAAKQCRLIRERRITAAISLPDIFSQWSDDLNCLDGLTVANLKNENNKSVSIGSSSNDSRVTLTSSKQRRTPSPRPRKKASGGHDTLSKITNNFFTKHTSNSIISQFFAANKIMKSRIAEKSATMTMGKSKKKRTSIFAFFSRKKKAEGQSTLDDQIPSSHLVEPKDESMRTPESRKSTVGTSHSAVVSRKKFPAPAPPVDEANKENFSGVIGRKRSSATSSISKFSRQESHRSSRNASLRRRRANVKSKENTKNEEQKTDSSSIKEGSETKILNNDGNISQSPIEGISVETTSKQTKDSAEESDITTDMIFASTERSSPTEDKKEKREDLSPESEEVPPVVPSTSPPASASVTTNYSFTPVKSSSETPTVKRLSNFGLNPAKLPPIPVSAFEDVTDTPSETSSNCTMPVQTPSTDLKTKLQLEHKKLLELFDEWESLRRPLLNHPRFEKLPDHLRKSIDTVMMKQEALLKQHSLVNALYQQLLAPITLTTTSSNSTIKARHIPTKHIIGTEKATSTPVRSPLPPMFRSRSTVDINGDNNNIKTEPQRNDIPIGSYSPRISQTKRHSLENAFNNRPKLGNGVHMNNNANDQPDQKTRKYFIQPDTKYPVVRNIPILPASPKLSESTKDSGFFKDSIPEKEVRTRPTENVKEYNIPIRTVELESSQSNINGNGYRNAGIIRDSAQRPSGMTTTLANNAKCSNPITSKESPNSRFGSTTSSSTDSLNNGYFYSNGVRKNTTPLSPQLTKKQITVDRMDNRPNPTKFANENSSPVQKEVKYKAPTEKPVNRTTNNNKQKLDQNLVNIISSFPAVTLRKVPKPIEKSFNVGRVLEDNEVPSGERVHPDVRPPVTNSAPHPPPPPPLLSSNKPSNPPPPPNLKSQKQVPADHDTLRGDMLAEIRKAGGIQFLRSKPRQ